MQKYAHSDTPFKSINIFNNRFQKIAHIPPALTVVVDVFLFVQKIKKNSISYCSLTLSYCHTYYFIKSIYAMRNRNAIGMTCFTLLPDLFQMGIM